MELKENFVQEGKVRKRRAGRRIKFLGNFTRQSCINIPSVLLTVSHREQIRTSLRSLCELSLVHNTC